MTGISLTAKQAGLVASVISGTVENDTVRIFSYDEYVIVQVDDDKGKTVVDYRVNEDGTWEDRLLEV